VMRFFGSPGSINSKKNRLPTLIILKRDLGVQDLSNWTNE
jgi:hypothetical protein